MENDLRDVIAEVKTEFERYEQALVSNDVVALNKLFHNDPRTIRYGGSENLYGVFRDCGLPSRAFTSGTCTCSVENCH